MLLSTSSVAVVEAVPIVVVPAVVPRAALLPIERIPASALIVPEYDELVPVRRSRLDSDVVFLRVPAPEIVPERVWFVLES
jgi:hypothetical protein